MTTADKWNIVSGVIALIAFSGAVLHWLIKKYLAELRPNHGSSLHDKVTLEIIPLLKELRQDQVAIKSQVDKLEGRFEQHVDEAVE
jgi:hypothetical protein